jgi:deaminated glutathione amidase
VRAAAIQLNSNDEKPRNLEAAERLVRDAAADGAELVALPEKWNLLAGGEALLDGAEPLDGPSLTAARGWAAELGIHLLAGSVSEEAGERAFNTSVLIGPDGHDLAVYRKIHMFDVDVDGVSYRESEHERPGEELVDAEIPGLGRVGLSICYDLRFPELFRILAVRGALLLAIPSAFTTATGRDHWEPLLRARAIENQAFVLAPNQAGEAAPHFDSYGHSAIVDAWGGLLAVAPDRGECFVAADLDLAAQDRARGSLPSLANRRPGAYVWPQLMEAHS